jgi:hypothetical protein
MPKIVNLQIIVADESVEVKHIGIEEIIDLSNDEDEEPTDTMVEQAGSVKTENQTGTFLYDVGCDICTEDKQPDEDTYVCEQCRWELECNAEDAKRAEAAAAATLAAMVTTEHSVPSVTMTDATSVASFPGEIDGEAAFNLNAFLRHPIGTTPIARPRLTRQETMAMAQQEDQVLAEYIEGKKEWWKSECDQTRREQLQTWKSQLAEDIMDAMAYMHDCRAITEIGINRKRLLPNEIETANQRAKIAVQKMLAVVDEVYKISYD